MRSEPTTGQPIHYLFWLVLTTVFWGGSFVFNKIGFREVHPLLYVCTAAFVAYFAAGAV